MRSLLFESQILDPAEERRLADRMRLMLDLSRKHEGRPLAHVARREVERCRARLVVGHLRFIAFQARRFLNGPRPWRLEDLVSEGYTWLLTKTEHFDPARGFKFTTFAGVVLKNRFMTVTGRGQRPPLKLPKRVYAMEPETLSRLAVCHPADSLMEDEQTGMLRSATQALKPRERAVIERRFGLGSREPESLQAIGEDMGLTRERVRQVEVNALERLRMRVVS